MTNLIADIPESSIAYIFRISEEVTTTSYIYDVIS